MNYSFKVDNYNAADDLLGVVYIPEDERLSASFIRVEPADTQEETLERIKQMAPVEVWELELSRLGTKPAADAIVGLEGGATKEETLSAREKLTPVPDIEEVAAFKKRQLIEFSQMELDAIAMAQYPAYERETWTDQEKEARAFIEDPQAATPMLSVIAEKRGMTLEELASRVIQKADSFRELATVTVGIRQRLEDEIDLSVQNFESGLIDEQTARQQVESVQWPGLSQEVS